MLVDGEGRTGFADRDRLVGDGDSLGELSVHGRPQYRQLRPLKTPKSQPQDLRRFFRRGAGSEDACARQGSLRLNGGELGDVTELTYPGGGSLGGDQVPPGELGIDK
jgi:hypothetical protein